MQINMADRIAELLARQESFVAVRIYGDKLSASSIVGTIALVSDREIYLNREMMAVIPHEWLTWKEEWESSAREALARRKTETKEYTRKNEKIHVCLEVMVPRETVLIVGAGHIAVPLAQMAYLLGFHVVVLDDRPEFANVERFPQAKEIIVNPFAEGLAKYSFTPDTYVVLITRGHTYDRECLKEVLSKNVAYIGMICSLRRKASVFDLLKQEGYTQEVLDSIYAPIGLPIGGETPEEIALSILSEIVAVRNCGKEWAKKLKIS